MNNQEKVAPKKINVLEELASLGTKIRHKSRIAESAGCNDRILSSLEEEIQNYLLVCITGLKEGAIHSDPYSLVYGNGFEKGNKADLICQKLLKEMASKDDFIASLQIQHAGEKGKNLTTFLSDGTKVMVSGAKKTISFVVGGILFTTSIVLLSATAFFNWIKGLIQKAILAISPKKKEEEKNATAVEGEYIPANA